MKKQKQKQKQKLRIQQLQSEFIEQHQSNLSSNHSYLSYTYYYNPDLSYRYHHHQSSQNNLQRMTVEQIQLQHLKSTITHAKIARQNQQKINLISLFIFNQGYKKLSQAFLLLKQYSQNISKTQSKIQFKQSDNHNHNEQRQKIITFQNTTKKLKVKAMYIFLRNYINKHYLNYVFFAIKSHSITDNIEQKVLRSGKMLKQTYNKVIQQQKDLRFIKKKIFPHKIIQNNQIKSSQIQTLSNITINGYQLQSLKKTHFQGLVKFDQIVKRKVLKHYIQGMSQIKQTICQQTQYNENNKKINELKQKQKQKQNPQRVVFTNVLKHMCYLSSKLSKKKQQKQIKYRKSYSSKRICLILQKVTYQFLCFGFYSLKLQNFRQIMQIRQKILYLQKIKEEFLSFFNENQQNQSLSEQIQ